MARFSNLLFQYIGQMREIGNVTKPISAIFSRRYGDMQRYPAGFAAGLQQAVSYFRQSGDSATFFGWLAPAKLLDGLSPTPGPGLRADHSRIPIRIVLMEAMVAARLRQP
jgi:hypothetical protein